jgi:hypothetical protein
MLRISRFRTSQPDASRALQALDVAREAAEAASKVPGVRQVRVFLGSGGLVFAGEADGYASADKILTDPACQKAFGKLLVEYGYNIDSDEFLLEPQQVYPFLKR